MRIEYETTEEDILNFHEFHCENSPTRNRQLILTWTRVEPNSSWNFRGHFYGVRRQSAAATALSARMRSNKLGAVLDCFR